jgi:hypothetical protein
MGEGDGRVDEASLAFRPMTCRLSNR